MTKFALYEPIELDRCLYLGETNFEYVGDAKRIFSNIAE